MGAFTTAAMLTLSAASTLSGAAGSRRAARGARAAGAYEGAMLDENARLEGLRAEDALRRGRETENQVRSETRQVRGSQRSALAAQGVDIDQGSAADIQAEAESFGAMDALQVRRNAQLEAWGYRSSETSFRNQANLARKGGDARAGAYNAQANSTLLTGGAQLAGMGYDAYRNRRRR